MLSEFLTFAFRAFGESLKLDFGFFVPISCFCNVGVPAVAKLFFAKVGFFSVQIDAFSAEFAFAPLHSFVAAVHSLWLSAACSMMI